MSKCRVMSRNVEFRKFLVCREMSSNVVKCWVLKISAGLSNGAGAGWRCLELVGAGWRCLELVGAGWRCLGCFGLGGAVFGWFHRWLRHNPEICDASRNVEKCWEESLYPQNFWIGPLAKVFTRDNYFWPLAIAKVYPRISIKYSQKKFKCLSRETKT